MKTESQAVTDVGKHSHEIVDGSWKKGSAMIADYPVVEMQSCDSGYRIN